MRVPLYTLLIAAALPCVAQQVNNTEKTLACTDGSRHDGRQERFCEMREFPVAAAPRISVDGRTNGGISVKGWTRNDMLVRAKVETWAASESEARSLASQVNIQTGGSEVKADAPDFGRDRGWAVSYEIFVPHRTGLALKAHNGGIRITDVTGEITFDALNGGVSLARLGGNVHGKTTNGGLKIELVGPRWDGNGLDVSATNGGVALTMPENYSARLEAGTVNGNVSVDFPMTVSGNLNKNISVTLGGGGPLIRATTTNGGISVRRKG